MSRDEVREQDWGGTHVETRQVERTNSIGDRVLDFYLNGERPNVTTPGIAIMDPFATPEVKQAAADFYATFYPDNRDRVLMIGINPGRFGGGLTGIPFTDPWALTNPCGIATTITGQRELSSVFVYDMIEHYGGPTAFFGDVLLSAGLPFGLISGRKNVNYYDDRTLMSELTPYILRTLETQLTFGGRRDVAIVLGTGKNHDYLRRINAEYRFFDQLIPLEHPRFIMQYRLKRKDEYLERYVDTLNGAVNKS